MAVDEFVFFSIRCSVPKCLIPTEDFFSLFCGTLETSSANFLVFVARKGPLVRIPGLNGLLRPEKDC